MGRAVQPCGVVVRLQTKCERRQAVVSCVAAGCVLWQSQAMTDANAASKATPTTSIRLEQEILDRTDRLIERLSKNPAYEGLHLSRHDLLRMAIRRGLADLEAHQQTAQASAPSDQGKQD